ncbi:MAG: cytochrome P450 [Burkholderiaceae bacterium]
MHSDDLNSIDVSSPSIYKDDRWQTLFARLRADDPVHFCDDSPYGPYWSITRFDDIVNVEVDYETFSAEIQGNKIDDLPPGIRPPTFISMDPPKHTGQRKTVAPIAARRNLSHYEVTIRERTKDVINSLPRGQPFNWVSEVSTKLTTMMLATLFDFPWADRDMLAHWAEVVVADINDENSPVSTEKARLEELKKMGEYFSSLWKERQSGPPKLDLLSIMAHSPAMAQMSGMEFIGNIGMLIVAASDTTKNTMSGGASFVCDHPDEWEKVLKNRNLMPSFVAETVRYQSAIIYFRRTATRDVNLRGKTIHRGDKVVMWYVSGNRDESAIDEPDKFIADRDKYRHHLGFGAGIREVSVQI